MAASQERAEEAVEAKSEEEVTVEWTAGGAEAMEAEDSAATKKSLHEIHSASLLICTYHGIIRCQNFFFLSTSF